MPTEDADVQRKLERCKGDARSAQGRPSETTPHRSASGSVLHAVSSRGLRHCAQTAAVGSIVQTTATIKEEGSLKVLFRDKHTKKRDSDVLFLSTLQVSGKEKIAFLMSGTRDS